MTLNPVPSGANAPGAPTSEGQGVGASGLAHSLEELRTQLLNEFIEKCGPFRATLSMALGDKSITKKAIDLYSFIVFNISFSPNGNSIFDASSNPPVHVVMDFTNTIPRLSVEEIRSYARSFNEFKAESARRVIESCGKLLNKKVRTYNISTTGKIISDIYRLAMERKDISLEALADWLSKMRVKEFLEGGYMLFSDSHVDILRRLIEEIDKDPLAYIVAKELRRIVTAELKARRREAYELTSFLVPS